MVLDIKMCRFENVAWGFRLVGGADYDYPLTVVKVSEGSIADEAGLRVDDVIVRINDTAAMPLTHDEAHRIIMNSGSVFYFGVYRENEEEEACEAMRRFPLSGSSTGNELPAEAASARNTEAGPMLWMQAQPQPEPEQEAVAQKAQQQQQPEQQQSTTELEQLEQQEAQEQAEQVQAEQQQAELYQQQQPLLTVDHCVSEVQSEDYRDALYLPDLPDRPCSVLSEQTEIKLVEEEIAAVLSGESEVLKEHNVLGIFPKPGVCMTSDVLRSLNEEVTKTKLEKEKENRKWSTFLQRPDRPVPKSKQQLEAERRAANAYKVKIVKSAPRDKSPRPEAKPKEATPPPPVKEATPPAPVKEATPEEEEPLPTDSEVPNLEQLPENGNMANNAAETQHINSQNDNEDDDEQLEKTDMPKAVETEDAEVDTAADEQQQEGAQEQEAQLSAAVMPNGKTEEELALEKQLADVQKQLAALSTLPSTIQSTLDAVTKQLADLLPTFKLQQQQQQQQPLPQIDEVEQNGHPMAIGDTVAATAAAADANDAAGAAADAVTESAHESEAADVSTADRCHANDLEVAEISRSNEDNRIKAAQPMEELSEEQCFKKQKIAFWNRLFNGEHITRQRFRELQSLSLAHTQKVNFMKYQKPERKIDLNRSEVYKVIHHLDRAPIRGIEVRAPLVAAESDIRQALQS